jgi:ankyrin repeat protein
LADILLDNGASLTLIDSNKNTPFSICLEQDNIKLLEKLIKGLSLNTNPHLLHSLKSKILNVKYQAILKQLIANDPPTKATMNVLEDLGLTPFLNYIEYFCSRYTSLR